MNIEWVIQFHRAVRRFRGVGFPNRAIMERVVGSVSNGTCIIDALRFFALVDVVRQCLIAGPVKRVNVSHGWGGNGAAESM